MASFEEILEMKEKKDIDNLIINLNNNNKDIRAFVTQTLGDIGNEKSSESIIPLLEDQSKKVRKEAAMALGLLNDPKSVKPLITALKDEDEGVRQVTAFALIRIGDKSSIPFLIEALNDESENVREIATWGVEAFENRNDDALDDRLDDYGEKLQLNIKPKSFLRTPLEIVDIISNITYYSNPEKVYDPACGSGSLISGLMSKLGNKAKIFCSGMNKEFFEKNIDISNINLIYDDFFEFKEKTDTRFDIIVSDMFIYTINPENITKKNIKFKIALLIDSLELLNDNGRLIFLIPDNFLYSDKFHEARRFIQERFSLECVISIPPKVSYFYSGVKTSLIIIKNAIVKESFFAEYKNSSAMDDIVQNFINHKTNKNLSQGFWLDVSVINKDNVPWNFGYLKGLNKDETEETSQYEVKLLSELTKVKDYSKNNYSIIFPKDNDLTDFRFVFKNELRQDFDKKKFFYFDIMKKFQDKISPQYLKFYLNRDDIQSKLHEIQNRGIIQINDLKSIPIEIPKKKIQDKIIEASDKCQVLQRKMEIINNNFSEDISHYSEVIKLSDYITQRELIWPIVNSFHISKTSTTDLDGKIKKCFKFFEFISALNAIVLISALPKELFLKEKGFIFNVEKSDYSKPTFGDWVGLYNRLKGVYMSMEKNKSFFETIPFNKKFYEELTNKEFSSILHLVVEMRNKYYHGEELPEFGKKELLIELDHYLSRFFDLLNVYSSIELIYTISMKKNNGLYFITVKKLQGASYPFQEITIKTDEDMDTDVLYIYSPSNEQRLKLKTEFIRLIECKHCGKYSLYIYNRLNRDSTHYISYQDEIHSYDDPKNPMKELLY